MGAQIDAKLEGVDDLLKNLKKWQIIKREACAIALKSVGFKVERDAKMGCPVWTGRLRSSLTTNWSGSGMGRAKGQSPAKSDDGVGQPDGEPGLVVVVGTNIKYAHMQEFGSWGDSPKPGPGMPIPKRKHEPSARPKEGFQFLTRAYVKNKNEAIKRLREIMKKDEKV